MVDHFAACLQLRDAIQQSLRQGFAAGNQIFPRKNFPPFLARKQRRQMRRHDFEYVNPMLVHVAAQARRVGGLVVADQMQGAAGDQRGINAGVAEISGDG